MAVSEVSLRENLSDLALKLFLGDCWNRAFAGNGGAYTDDAKVAQLERTLGQVTLENALLKKAITVLKELERRSGAKR